MIYVEMNGRLGNQMFRYAFARAIKEKLYPDEKICLSFNEVNEVSKKDPSFRPEILNFKIDYDSIYKKEGRLLVNETSLKQKIMVSPYFLFSKNIDSKDIKKNKIVTSRFYNIFKKSGVYWFRYGYYEPLKSTENNKIVSGNFESSRYFDFIRDILLKEFEPIYPINKNNYGLLSKILNNNSVCVSIRRGDFLNPENSIHNVCTEKYFYNAFHYMQNKLEKPVFVFFSDDIEWVKKNIKLDCECYFETGKDPVYEKLALMYSCKHFIISNSTFSWRAQYLSKNEKKIIVSPPRWFTNVDDYDLIEKSFVKISNF